MKKGVLSTELIVLLTLYDSEMSGVEILHFINESSGEPGFVPRGSVYSALQKLEGKGLVQSRVFDDRSRAGARRYHRLTDEGVVMIDSVLEFQKKLKEK